MLGSIKAKPCGGRARRGLPGHYERRPHTKARRGAPQVSVGGVETAIIERYRQRESSVEEALIEMYLTGVSVRQSSTSLAHSTVKCNGQISGAEENLARGLVAEYLSGARVEFVLDPLDIGIGQNREVGTFWEVLPEEAVRV